MPSLTDHARRLLSVTIHNTSDNPLPGPSLRPGVVWVVIVIVMLAGLVLGAQPVQGG